MTKPSRHLSHTQKASKKMCKQKRPKRSKTSDIDVELEEETPSSAKRPGQPTVTALELKPLVMKLKCKPCDMWTKEERQEVAAFMSNRTGIDNSRVHERYSEFDAWYANFCRLMEIDPEFDKAVDPWYLIIHSVASPALLLAIDEANVHLGGGGVANGSGEPIQFFNGLSTFLHIPAGREEARRTQSFIEGRMNAASFHSTVLDGRAALYQ